MSLRKLHIGKKYASTGDVVVLLGIDLETDHVRCEIIKELDDSQRIPVGLTFDIMLCRFIAQYSICLDWDKEMDDL